MTKEPKEDFSFIDTVKKSELFEYLRDEDVDLITRMAQKETLKTGDVIVNQGEPMNFYLIVESGAVSKVRNGEELLELREHDSSGLFHFFSKDPAFASLIVKKDNTVVWKIHTDDFTEAMKKDPHFTISFTHFLAKKVREQSNLIRYLTSNKGGNKLNVAFYDSKDYMKEVFDKLNNERYQFNFKWFKEKLNPETAVLAIGCTVVSCFVNDDLSGPTVNKLAEYGVQLIALRCAGFDNVDLETCHLNKISVIRAPAYSPYAVAEFAVGLMLTLIRKIYKSVERVKQYNFSLHGLTGFDIHGKTIGVIGTGKIGVCVINILEGFGVRILCYDVRKDPKVEAKESCKYVELDELLANSDIITLHAPLLKSTKYMINKNTLSKMKDGVYLINTSRGGLVNTNDLIESLKNKKIGGVALDVYEGEKNVFFENVSEDYIQDNTLTQLLAQHNVIVTGHQAFLTTEALTNIAEANLQSLKEFEEGKRLKELSNNIDIDTKF